MNRKTTALAATLVAATVITPGVWTAQASSTSTGRHVTTITYLDRINPETNIDVDLGDTGPSVGDQQVFEDALYQNGKRVGSVAGAGEIIVLTSAGLTIQAVATATFPAGKLTFQLSFSERFADGPPSTTYGAITGGTGDYADARGACISERINNHDDSRVTCHVVLGG